MTIDTASDREKVQIIAAMLLASVTLKSNARLPRVSDLVGVQGLIALSSIACGFISLTGLHWHFPRIDQPLLLLDRAIGFDGPAFVSWIAGTQFLHRPLTAAYVLTVPALLLSIGLAVILGHRLEAWRATFCFVGSLPTVCLMSAFMPAKGLGVWIPDQIIALLPQGAARYFWPAFDAFYGAGDIALRSTAIDGVVSFPSFHMVMGLTTLTLWRGRLTNLLCALVWFSLMIVATVPLGGHYLIDLIGGLAVWSCWFALSSRLAGSCQQMRTLDVLLAPE